MAINLKVTVNEYKGENGLVGFANVVFDDKYALEGVRIREGQYGPIVDLPTYPVSKKDEKGNVIKNDKGEPVYEYREVLHPTSPEVNAAFSKIIKAEYQRVKTEGKETTKTGSYELNGDFNISRVNANPFERDHLVGLGSIYFGNAFCLDKIRIKLSDEKILYIESPMYKTLKKDENGVPELNDNGENVFEYKAHFHAITKESYHTMLDCVVDALNRSATNKANRTAENAPTVGQSDDIENYIVTPDSGRK